MLKHALEEDAMSHTQVFKCFRSFKHGEMGVKDHVCSVHHSILENFLKISPKINAERRFIIDEISEEKKILFGSFEMFGRGCVEETHSSLLIRLLIISSRHRTSKQGLIYPIWPLMVGLPNPRIRHT